MIFSKFIPEVVAVETDCYPLTCGEEGTRCSVKDSSGVLCDVDKYSLLQQVKLLQQAR